MEDVVFACFAQLSYLNWHNLNLEKEESKESKKLRDIINKENYFEILKNGDYANIYPKGKDYLREDTLSNGEKANIYDRRDARMFILYSEDMENPNRMPKFPDLQKWEFLCGYDHNKIREELGENRWILKEKDSGFQASAFKKDGNIILAYRGSDDMKVEEHFESDWLETNFRLGFNIMPDALICTAWMYDKVKELAKGKEINITGHSMGGALAQFATIYSEGKHKMVTWSALGIGDATKEYQINNVSETNKWLNFDFFKDILKDYKFFKHGKWQTKSIFITENEIKEMLQEALKRKKQIVDTRTDFTQYEISEEEMERLAKEIKYKQKLVYKYQKNYENLNKADNSEKYINYYYGQDLTPNLQEKQGPVKTVDNVTDKNSHDNGGTGLWRKLVAIVSSNVSEYHGIPMYFPFMDDDGNVTPGKMNNKYVKNGIKTIIKSDYQYEIEAREMMLSNNPPSSFPRKIDKSLEAYNRVSGNNIPNPKKEFTEDMGIRSKFLFWENLIDATKELKKEWYTVKGNEMICGVFNNFDSIGGVSGGTEFIVKQGKSFDEVLNMMLPPIKTDKEISCDVNALEKHKISYDKNKVSEEGYVNIALDEKEYKNDYKLYPENKFGTKSEEGEGKSGIHLGIDVSYGRENAITCSHPDVYSPVNGVIDSVKPNKVVIRQDKIEKVINGNKVDVYYYHEIEHLHKIDSNIKEELIVNCGSTKIGKMGGVGDEDNLYKYYQHVHYSIRMEDAYYTGYVDYNTPYSDKNIKKRESTKPRYLNPEKFWDSRVEEGRIDFDFQK